MVLPEGFTIPPLIYLVPTVALLTAAGVLLWTLRPTVTDRLVIAIVPWIVAGGGGHVLYVTDAVPAGIEPFFGVPAVYLTFAALGAVTWLLAEVTSSTRTAHDAAWYLGIIGLFLAIILLIWTLWWGWTTGDLALLWPSVAVVGSIVGTAVVWVGMARLLPGTAQVTGATGMLVLFGHGLDAISTLIGIDVLGGAERSPLSDAVIYIGSRLPTAEFIGDTWLFVVVKFALAIAILVLFREYVREEPTQARLLLAFIAAVGLGPGVHNVLLFTLAMTG